MSVSWIGEEGPAQVGALLEDVEGIARSVPSTDETPDARASDLQARVHDQPGTARQAERQLARHLAQHPDDETAFRMWRILRDAETIDGATDSET